MNKTEKELDCNDIQYGASGTKMCKIYTFSIPCIRVSLELIKQKLLNNKVKYFGNIFL